MAIADPSEVLETVKLRLQLTGITLDALINSYVREIGRRIKHFCNVEEIPEALTDTWTSMVMDAVRVELPNVDEINESAGGVDNVKIGDTSISPVGSSGLSNTAKTVIDKVVLNYRIDLTRYRKLRW
ncbi:DNA-packaging protein [Paenibacillus antarcticus]|uniref:DNA-packaging protein n=1 Tax=Paenibacillus antarcticus TaxID=253703 RepID=A0A168P9Y7_9BACL|nr:DNA-packaging protein [Paenibacillus antarcticus]OAB46548.1 DNA-packaging protein [Paenibacillus antarcticus]